MADRPAYSVRVRALIIRDGMVLVFEQVDGGSAREGRDLAGLPPGGKKWYLLPGGEQKPGETLPETVARECMEELGCRIVVGELAFVRDYLAKNHELAHEGNIHEVEMTFLVKLVEEPDMKRATRPDRPDSAPCWLPVSGLSGVELYPKGMRESIRLIAEGKPHPLYLGEIN